MSRLVMYRVVKELTCFLSNSKTSRGRREHSNLDDDGEDESPRPVQAAEDGMKQEVFDAADPALNDTEAARLSSRTGEERARNGAAEESAVPDARKETSAEGRTATGESVACSLAFHSR